MRWKMIAEVNDLNVLTWVKFVFDLIQCKYSTLLISSFVFQFPVKFLSSYVKQSTEKQQLIMLEFFVLFDMF